jgi:DNA polymerase-3 subunit alpha
MFTSRRKGSRPGTSGRGGGAIRFGLAAIKGVGEVAVQCVLEARRGGGRFESLNVLCERVDTRAMNRKVLEAFIRSGACDSLGGSRAGMFAQIESALARGQSAAQDRASGQSSLFGMLDAAVPAVAKVPVSMPEWPLAERLAAEKELLGFYVTGHPLDPYRPLLETYSLSDTSRLATVASRSMTRLGGILTAVQQGFSKKSGKPYALLTLEDLGGSVQVLCLNEAFENHRDLFVAGRVMFVIGEVHAGEDRPKIFLQEMYPLEEVPRRLTKQVHLRLRLADLSSERLRRARDLVAAHAGSCPLFLCLLRADGAAAFVEVNDRYRVHPTVEFQRAVEGEFGEAAYFAKADPTLPERPRRRWEQAGGNGDGG